MGITFLHFSMMKYLKRTTYGDDPEVMLSACNSLCEKLFKETSSLTKENMEMLVRCLPLNLALQCCISLSSKEKEYLTPAQMDILNAVYIVLESRIPFQLVSQAQQNDLADILKTWKFIYQIEFLKEKFFDEYEDVVLKLLESSANISSDIVIMFVDEHGFFTNPTKWRRLVQILAKTNGKQLNKPFFALAKHHRVKEQLLSLSRADIYELCVQLTTDQSYQSEQSLSFACRRLNDIWGLPQMETSTYKEVWDEILVKEFKKYTMQQLMYKLDEINYFSEQNSHFGEIFLKYSKSKMEGTNVTFKPQEIFMFLGERQAKPRINNMLSVQLLILVMETLAKLYRTDMFGRFLDMLQHADFWQKVYSCHGDFVCHLYKTECFKKSKACFVHMVNQFKGHNVSYDFVDSIQKDVKLLKASQTLLRLECNEKDLHKWWEEALLKFKQEKDKLKRASNVLETIFKKIHHEKLREDMSELLHHVKSKEEELMTGNLTAKDCMTIWNGLEQLPELCENLEDVIHSNLFWNVSLETSIQKCTRTSQDNEDNNDDSKNNLTLSAETATKDFPVMEKDRISVQFLKILSGRGKVLYKNMWKEVLENTTLRMDRVIEAFGPKPDVKHEVELAKQILDLNVDATTQNALKRIYSIDKVQFTVDAVVSALGAFKVKLDEDFSCAIHSFNQLRKGSANDISFQNVKLALETVFRSTAGLSDSTISIMDELGKSTSLIDFLQDILDEDIRNLIDAVEDISEQQVRETTVSNLIEVKQYIQPLLISRSETCQDLISMLESQTKNAPGNPSHLATKVSDCMCHLHNLKSLYNNVANRGEQTKEMIENIILKGTFAFKLDNESSSVTFEVKYSQDEKGRVVAENEKRPKSTLIDLRSRALLLKNSDKKEAEDGPSDKEKLSIFVDYIDDCLDIAESLFELYSSGHFEFMTINQTYHPGELQATKIGLTETLKEWTHNLIHARETYFLLNFIHGTQIQKLFLFLESKENDRKAILTMARFIHPDMNIENMRGIYHNVKTLFPVYDEESKLMAIGLTLHKVLDELGLFERTISSTISAKITEIVKAGRLLVAHLEEGSIFTVKTVLSLYINSTQRVPEANQVLFCTRYTVWEEINLLIKRCLGASAFYHSMPLFCIANVELLPNELQFALVDLLRNVGKNQKFLLALVCRGSANHPFIDKLNEYVTSVAPASDITVKSLFEEHCEKVLAVTSDQAGQGKSSFIEKIAHLQHKCVTKLHISGPIKKHKLLERLQSLNIKEHHMLHIDIGAVDDPTELDTFLFELIILKYVSAGRIAFSLKTDNTKIEIGNTINDSLRNSLQTTVLFRRKHIVWKGFEALSVSKEPESSVQVVCKYLKAMEKNVLDKTDFPNSLWNEPLSRTSCRNILKKYVSSTVCVSFPVMNTFLDVLADQLKKLSQSTFFKVSRLRDMVGSKSQIEVKSKLVSAMLKMSQDFASRSVAECRNSQISTLGADRQGTEIEHGKHSALAASLVDRINSMIRWEESNHLIFVFHNQNIHTLSALYRSLDNVAEDVKDLFNSQMKKKMTDFTKLDQNSLQNMLQKVARTNPKPLKQKYLQRLAQDMHLLLTIF